MQNEQLGAEVAHPDADLLTAFAEQALPARERDQVLTHLAQCADCREVAALAGAAVIEPELVAAVAVGKPAIRRTGGFLPLRPLRWTAAAATAAVVLSAVWLNRREVQRQDLTAGTETSPAIVQPQNEPTTPPALATPENEATTLTNAPAGDKESTPKASALRTDNPSKPDALSKTKAALPKERAELEAGSVNGLAVDEFVAEKKQSVTGNVTVQKDMPMLRARQLGQSQAATTPSNQTVGGPVFNVSGAAAKTERALPSAHSVSSNDVALAPQRAPRAPEVTMTYSHKTAAELAPADQVAESQTSSNASGATRDAASQVRVGPMATPLPDDQASLQALQKSADLKAAGTLWRVSSSGELQQSTDSGHNWQTSLGEHPSKFRSVASAGATVWAGGDDGVLWSSLNNGLTWRKSAPSVDGHSPRGTVQNIQLAAPRNVTFRTSAGETWSSADGGINWTVKSE
jgi:Putative zinc-finger